MLINRCVHFSLFSYLKKKIHGLNINCDNFDVIDDDAGDNNDEHWPMGECDTTVSAYTM